VGSISGPQTVNFCLAAGCYRFIIRDSYGDGICCGTNGDGSYTITDANGTVIGTGGEFTNSDTVLFCIGTTTLENLWFEQTACKVYPNPASNMVNVEIQSDILTEKPIYSLIDASGKLVKTGKLNQIESQINLEYLSAGLYALRIEGKTGAIIRKFLLN
jgi:hypothetical protein